MNKSLFLLINYFRWIDNNLNFYKKVHNTKTLFILFLDIFQFILLKKLYK